MRTLTSWENTIFNLFQGEGREGELREGRA